MTRFVSWREDKHAPWQTVPVPAENAAALFDTLHNAGHAVRLSNIDPRELAR